MSVAEIKAEIIEEINNADEGRLFEIQNLLQSSHFDIPEHVLNRIKLAQQQALEGKGVLHEDAMKRLNSWKEK